MYQNPALNLLEEIVVTEGIDKGVVLLSCEGTTHKELRFKPDDSSSPETVEVYDNVYFSPLGDKLIELYELLLLQAVELENLRPYSAIRCPACRKVD